MALHRYERLVLSALKGSGALDLNSLTKACGIGTDEVLWALENLGRRGYVGISRTGVSEVTLTKEGAEYAKEGLPETRLLDKLREGTILVKELSGKDGQIGLQWAKRKELIRISNGAVMLSDRGVSAMEKGLDGERVLRELNRDSGSYGRLRKENGNVVSELIKRGLLSVKERQRISMVTLTDAGERAVDMNDEEGIGALDRSIIAGRAWEGKSFKTYDTDVQVEEAIGARRHPLARNIESIRRAYISNGFREVAGPVIDSAFWVFDSLFQPQDHPARDAQDTFYLSGLEEMEVGNKEYVRRVREAHTEGWHYRWDLDTAQEAVLRTHTTSVSARYIYDVLSGIGSGSSKRELPIKLFSLGRIFRNENIDYRHLADFYQSDGIIIGNGLTFANLFDTLIRLYSWLGAELRFKPSYFPFVEPGVEIYAYAERLGEWVEIGGAGMVRREITGMRRGGINVLAWGVGVERLMLLRDAGVKSIAELYNGGLGWARRMPIV